MITNFTLVELDGYFSLQLFIGTSSISRVIPDSLDLLEIVHFEDTPALLFSSPMSIPLCFFPLTDDCSQRLATTLSQHAESRTNFYLSAEAGDNSND